MIASVAKAFTGAALIKHHETKSIDLGAPIQRYVPAFPDKAGAAVTARLLAAHLGGIWHYSRVPSPQSATALSTRLDNRAMIF